MSSSSVARSDADAEAEASEAVSWRLRGGRVLGLAVAGTLADAILLASVENHVFHEGGLTIAMTLAVLICFWLTFWSGLAAMTRAAVSARAKLGAFAARTAFGVVAVAAVALHISSWAIYFRAARFANLAGFEFIIANPPQTTWLYLGSGERIAIAGLAGAALLGIPAVAIFSGLLSRLLTTESSDSRGGTRLLRHAWACSVVAVVGLNWWMQHEPNPVQRNLRADLVENSVSPWLTLASSALHRWQTAEVPACLDASELREFEAWEPPEATPTNRPSVIFIAVESLRADVVDLVHQGREVTPNLNRLARNSVRFGRAYSQSTHSDYADVCIVSSLYPLRTQTHHYYQRSDPWPRTLAFDMFKQAGYQTAIISSQNESWGGMDRFLQTPGLDLFYDAMRSQQNTTGSVPGTGACIYGSYGCLPDWHTMDTAIAWVRENQRAGRPFFLSMNFQSSHFPYEVPDDAPRPFQPCHLDADVTFMKYPEHKTPQVRNAYFNAIHYCDFQLGRMVETLRQLEMLDDVVLVVMGENGEAFHENGSVGHAREPVEPAIHVANVIHAPRYLAAGSEDYPTELIDLLPTVCGILGWPVHPNFQGIDVLSPNRPPLSERLLFFHTNSAVAQADAVQWAGRWKYLQNYRTGESALFDLQTDPQEATDVSSLHPRLAGRLRQTLQTWRQRQLAYYHYPQYYNSFYPPSAPKLPEEQLTGTNHSPRR